MRSTSRPPVGLGREAALYFRLAGRMATGVVPAAGFDWQTFRAIARRDGTTSAVTRRLREVGIAVPEATGTALAREAQVLDFHRLRLERALDAALDVLYAAGLRPVLLKGAALSRVAYARPTDRPMSDADLLLSPADARAAVLLLRASGWREAAGDPDGAVATADPGYGAHHHLPPLVAPDGSGALVEVHHDVLPPGHPFGWDGSAVRGNAVALPGDVRAQVPSAVDLVLHACVHFAWAHELRHGAWRTFADLAALLAARDAGGAPLVDPAAVAERAARVGATSVLRWTARLASELAGVSSPAAWQERYAPGRTTRVLVSALTAELVPLSERAPAVLVARLAWSRAIRPSASGHGASRPWLVGRGRAAGRRAGSVTPRALAQVRQLSRWARWTRGVLGR